MLQSEAVQQQSVDAAAAEIQTIIQGRPMSAAANAGAQAGYGPRPGNPQIRRPQDELAASAWYPQFAYKRASTPPWPVTSDCTLKKRLTLPIIEIVRDGSALAGYEQKS